ncbi:MAG: single-stranded DNA-binding protein [Acidimicrobiales bacterium]
MSANFLLSLFTVKEIPMPASSESADPTIDLVFLVGSLARPPQIRTLPSATELVELEVSTRRPGERADTVPVTMFSPPRSVTTLTAGARVAVVGRVQRRFFRRGGRTESRTQVTADRVVPAGQRRRLAPALDAVRQTLDSFDG